MGGFPDTGLRSVLDWTEAKGVANVGLNARFVSGWEAYPSNDSSDTVPDAFRPPFDIAIGDRAVRFDLEARDNCARELWVAPQPALIARAYRRSLKTNVAPYDAPV